MYTWVVHYLLIYSDKFKPIIDCHNYTCTLQLKKNVKDPIKVVGFLKSSKQDNKKFERERQKKVLKLVLQTIINWKGNTPVI